MNEPLSSAPWSGRRLLFSLAPLVAVTTSVGAAFSLVRTLFLPPLGSSGLAEARLPALVLVIALWFCRSGLVARLGSYAVVASLLALLFFQRYLSQTDWLFGHTHGPPQLFVATSFASTIGVLAGIGWWVTRRKARQIEPAPAPALLRPEWRVARWLGHSAIVVLTLLSALLAVLTIPDLGKKLDDQVEQPLRIGRHSIRELAEAISNTRSPRRPEMAELMANQYDIRPDDEAAIPTLQQLVSDDDPRVRRAATTTHRHVIAHALNSGKLFRVDAATKATLVRGRKDGDELVQLQAALTIVEQNRIQFDDREARLSAITILGSAQDRDSVDAAVPALLGVIEAPRDDACRKEAIRSLGRIGPKIALGRSNPMAQVVPRLATEVETQGPTNVRSEAVHALAAMGPAAKAAVPAFGRAWDQHLLTIEEAQALYQIDPEAAEKLQIPRPNRDAQAKAAVPALNDALNDQDERVRHFPSAAWKSQAPFAGDPRNRPAGTICVAFDDGYRWLITEPIVRREQWVEGDRKIEALINSTRRYEHILGTQEVRMIDPMATPAVE